MPCWEKFEYHCKKVDEGYREKVMPSSVKASRSNWPRRLAGTSTSAAKARPSISGFGESAPLKVLAEHFGFTTEKVVAAAKERLQEQSKPV